MFIGLTGWQLIANSSTGPTTTWVKEYVESSCVVVVAIRETFPEANNIYTGFKIADL